MKAARPPWWEPAFVLDWLRDHPGASLVSGLCAEVGAACGVAPKGIYEDLVAWRKADREFDAAVKAHVAPRAMAPGPGGPTRDQTDPDWRTKWGESYLAEGSKKKASDAVGRAWWRLKELLDPDGGQYDAEFAEVYKIVTEAHLCGIEDVANWSVQRAQELDDPKTAGTLAMQMLERLRKKKWSRSEERHTTISGKIEHVHTVQQQKVLAHVAETSRRLFGAAAVAALPSGERQAVSVELLEPVRAEG